jgi:large subunit ribosomal protein L7Ae
LDKYRPETKAQKKQRLIALAAAGSEAKPETAKAKSVVYGLNHVTSLIERRKAKLIVIAHDVDPLEVRSLFSTLLTV